MLSKPETASLLIADISGYTGYLAGVELDHAQDIIADLIDVIVGALRPPFHLSKLEGDAAFCLPAFTRSGDNVKETALTLAKEIDAHGIKIDLSKV